MVIIHYANKLPPVRDTEDFEAGVEYAIAVLAVLLDVGINDFSHDAATEEFEGDVFSVMGNCLNVRFGDDGWPDARSAGE